LFIKPHSTLLSQLSVMSCDILDHIADEILSNKARVTLQINESTRDAGTMVGQGGSKNVEGNANLKQTNH